MNSMLLKLYVKFLELKDNDEAQDLVEYALVISLVAVACVTGLGPLATAILAVFTKIEGSL